jgi:hypothetical protein
MFSSQAPALILLAQTWGESSAGQKLAGVLAGAGIVALFGWGWWNAIKTKEARKETTSVLLGITVKTLIVFGLVSLLLVIARTCEP